MMFSHYTFRSLVHVVRLRQHGHQILRTAGAGYLHTVAGIQNAYPGRHRVLLSSAPLTQTRMMAKKGM